MKCSSCGVAVEDLQHELNAARARVAQLREALIDEAGEPCNSIGCKHMSCAALAATESVSDTSDT